jgi:dihydrodipicolinate synthase/N-acetylneuraminate lyase
VWDREPEPATISGMALFLGLSSKREFEAYEETGRHATILKQGRLRVEAAYEARLYQTPTGVIFALKTMGWTDKPETRKPISETDNTLKVEIINTGPLPAGNEKEVIL